MQQVYSVLSAVSLSLLVPVVVLLLLCACVALWQAGAIVYESWLRHRSASSYRAAIQRLASGTDTRWVTLDHAATGPRLLADWLRACSTSGRQPVLDVAERALDQAELHALARLERFRLLARLGPALGLMGTLIPLGPALVALAQGDLQQLARNLVVAFGTTVIGLFVAVVAQLLAATVARWYAEDLADLEFLTRLIVRHSSSERTESDGFQSPTTTDLAEARS